MENKQIKFVHFQITKNCNLRCPFCGQWGEKGFFAKANGLPLAFEEWLDVAKQLKETGSLPQITIWGGEPLMCPFFDDLSEELCNMGFKLRLVTNGVLLDKHIEIIKKCYDRIYVSVDGLEKLHDSIRGRGVFEKVTHNLKLLDSKKVMLMAVLTPALNIKEYAEFFSGHQILLQTMIALSKDEISRYKAWFSEVFGYEAVHIDSWLGEINTETYLELPHNVLLMEHGERARNAVCDAPFNHIHITWNGNVTFCTDFYDFSAGNVREERIDEIFCGEKAERFRSEVNKGNCLSCNHCSWRNGLDV